MTVLNVKRPTRRRTGYIGAKGFYYDTDNREVTQYYPRPDYLVAQYYSWHHLDAGDRAYWDRPGASPDYDWPFESPLPDVFFDGLTYAWSNQRARHSIAADTLVFEIYQPRWVYIFWPNGETLPSWMGGFADISKSIRVNNGASPWLQLDVYQKLYSAGIIRLGGAEGAAYNYVPALQPSY